MSENSKIEWCHHTFNPWIGCTKVGPGCDNCYAEADFDKRKHVVKWGVGQPRKRTVPSNWAHPLRWNAEAERLGVRYRVFCASLADVFDNEVPAEWRADLFDLIERTPHLDWLLVTKRIGNVRQMIPDRWSVCMPRNIWLGITVVNQDEADRDIPKLMRMTGVSVRFLSMEPLIGPVDLRTPRDCWGSPRESYLDEELENFRINWVIVGGESGSKARPMRPQWARDLRDQCEEAGVPFLFKQHGEFADMQTARIVQSGPVMDSKGNVADWMRQAVKFSDGRSAVVRAHTFDGHSTNLMYRVGKKAAGRILDGVLHDGYPTPQ